MSNRALNVSAKRGGTVPVFFILTATLYQCTVFVRYDNSILFNTLIQSGGGT